MTNTMTLHRAAMLPRLLAVGAALAASVMLGSTADAQPPGGRGGRGGPGGRGGDPEQMIERRVARMTETLTLDANQAASIREILTEQHAQLAALRPAERPVQRPDSATRAEMRAKLDAIHEGTEQRIEGVLTAEQRTKYAALREARDGRGGPGRAGRGGFGGPGRGGFRGQRPPPPAA